jgi:hypothetical protein
MSGFPIKKSLKKIFVAVLIEGTDISIDRLINGTYHRFERIYLDTTWGLPALEIPLKLLNPT